MHYVGVRFCCCLRQCAYLYPLFIAILLSSQFYTILVTFGGLMLFYRPTGLCCGALHSGTDVFCVLHIHVLGIGCLRPCSCTSAIFAKGKLLSSM